VTPAESGQASVASEATLPFDRAYTDLVQALEDALTTTAQYDWVTTRFTEYLTLLEAAMSGQDVQVPCAQAYTAYIEALQDALSAEPQQQRAREAFDRYMDALRDAWTAIDPRTLTPLVAASVAQQIMTSASTVAGIGRTQARTSGSFPPDLST
jgi:hypothetical protein